jgi:hypothetical protein
MKNVSKKSIVPLLLLLSLSVVSSCQPGEALVDLGKKKSKNDNASVKPQLSGIDLEKDCGIKAAKEGEEVIVFQQNFKGLPFQVTGAQLGMKFKVTLIADLNIINKLNLPSERDLKVRLKSVSLDTSSPLIKTIGTMVAKGKAEEQAKESSKSPVAVIVSNGEWLNITSENEEYKDVFCGIAPGTKSMDFASFKDKGNVEFSPVLVDSVNPNATPEVLEREIGDGRTFKVQAKIIKARSDWPTGTVDGTVTFKKIAPTYTTTSGQTISSDLAYEIVQDFPKKSGSKFESTLSGKRQFFINTTDKKFEAIIEFKNENKDGKTSPIVLLKE